MNSPRTPLASVAPRVSVVIPAHQAEGFLLQALESVRVQTMRDIEILVVDDGSGDGTHQVIRQAAAQDRRIRPFRHSASQGVSAARNTALLRARGRWIALLDADDLWHPARLARLVPMAERLGLDVLADDLLVEDFETGAPRGRHMGEQIIRDMPAPMTPTALVEYDMPGEAGAIGYLKPLFRRAFLQEHDLRYDPALPVGEDLAFLFACMAAGARFRVARQALYRYRLRDASLSRRPGVARAQAAANRVMQRSAVTPVGAEALDLLHRRQDMLDVGALAEAAAEGSWLSALGHARWGRPVRLAGDLRVVAGAARRWLVA